MGWLFLLFIVIFLIWYRWDRSPAHSIGKLNSYSQLLCKFIFEKLAQDIYDCRITIKKYKGDSKFKKELIKELKKYEERVMNFLSMIHKHEEVKKYVYIHKSDKETLNVERDWYKYCLALYNLVGLKDYMAYTSDSYSDEQIFKISQNSPAIIKEVEEGFNEILLQKSD